MVWGFCQYCGVEIPAENCDQLWLCDTCRNVRERGPAEIIDDYRVVTRAGIKIPVVSSEYVRVGFLQLEDFLAHHEGRNE